MRFVSCPSTELVYVGCYQCMNVTNVARSNALNVVKHMMMGIVNVLCSVLSIQKHGHPSQQCLKREKPDGESLSFIFLQMYWWTYGCLTPFIFALRLAALFCCCSPAFIAKSSSIIVIYSSSGIHFSCASLCVRNVVAFIQLTLLWMLLLFIELESGPLLNNGRGRGHILV